MSSTTSTPENVTASLPVVVDNSQGTGSNTAYASQHTQKQYEPYPEADMQSAREISTSDYLHYVFAIGPNMQRQAVEDGVKVPPDFTKALDTYCPSMSHGTDRYDPFAHMVQRIDSKTGGKREIKSFLTRNDPLIIQGHRQHKIIGRGTYTVMAKVDNKNPNEIENPDIWAKEVDVKFNWAARTRVPETELIQRARNSAVGVYEKYLDHLPLIVHHEVSSPSPVSEPLAASLEDYEMRELRLS